ncbi:hypothetical protein HNR06_001280 [Nocardiopsis arvandica]|uniref:Uncharacterized protein n=1 Tax=Nocardiopsis sinuspersici TaxID=501010 RepID=A0A7Z0BI45_9ACTN|nr:hypothetical protein [Nocardiopsis sinuspersici]NYH51691.1 hypothetical protein [Nocardiopsis sinuspersici]
MTSSTLRPTAVLTGGLVVLLAGDTWTGFSAGAGLVVVLLLATAVCAHRAVSRPTPRH